MAYAPYASPPPPQTGYATSLFETHNQQQQPAAQATDGSARAPRAVGRSGFYQSPGAGLGTSFAASKSPFASRRYDGAGGAAGAAAAPLPATPTAPPAHGGMPPSSSLLDDAGDLPGAGPSLLMSPAAHHPPGAASPYQQLQQQQQQQQLAQHSAHRSPFAGAAVPATGSAGDAEVFRCWVCVYGFPASRTQGVLAHFHAFGDVLEHHVGRGNWLCMRYATTMQARMALAQNAAFLPAAGGDTTPVLLGVIGGMSPAGGGGGGGAEPSLDGDLAARLGLPGYAADAGYAGSPGFAAGAAAAGGSSAAARDQKAYRRARSRFASPATDRSAGAHLDDDDDDDAAGPLVLPSRPLGLNICKRLMDAIFGW